VQQAIWQSMCDEAREASVQQPLMASFFHANILYHKGFTAAISFYLANKLGSKTVPAMQIQQVFHEALQSDAKLVESMLADLVAYRERDPVCDQYIIPFLYHKGFHAVQGYRIAHWLYQQGRRTLAAYFQSQISALLDMDIHPAAVLGGGLMVDHATGVVIGETTIIEENVSMLHAVTLGGSGNESGVQRHPTIRRGVLLSAGSKILGPVDVGEGAKIGAGSIVLEDVPAHATVVGVPARIVARASASSPQPSFDMDHRVDVSTP